jgi:hypothetical protein
VKENSTMPGRSVIGQLIFISEATDLDVNKRLLIVLLKEKFSEHGC